MTSPSAFNVAIFSPFSVADSCLSFINYPLCFFEIGNIFFAKNSRRCLPYLVSIGRVLFFRFGRQKINTYMRFFYILTQC